MESNGYDPTAALAARDAIARKNGVETPPLQSAMTHRELYRCDGTAGFYFTVNLEIGALGFPCVVIRSQSGEHVHEFTQGVLRRGR